MSDGAEGAATEIIALDIDIANIEKKLDLLNKSFSSLGKTLPTAFNSLTTSANNAEKALSGLAASITNVANAAAKLKGISLPTLFSNAELNNLKAANLQMEKLAANTEKVTVATKGLANAQAGNDKAGVSQVIVRGSETASRPARGFIGPVQPVQEYGPANMRRTDRTYYDRDWKNQWQNYGPTDDKQYRRQAEADAKRAEAERIRNLQVYGPGNMSGSDFRNAQRVYDDYNSYGPPSPSRSQWRDMASYGGVQGPPSPTTAQKRAMGLLPQVGNNDIFGPTIPRSWDQDYWDSRVNNIDTKPMQPYEARQLIRRSNYSGGKQEFLDSIGTPDEAKVQAYANAIQKAEGILSTHAQTTKNWLQSAIGGLGTHIVQWGLFAVALGAANAAMEFFANTSAKASEAQVQGVLFRQSQQSLASATGPTDHAQFGAVQAQSIALAVKYGEEVNNVSQDISLWYKRTGDLGSAIGLTNETLKAHLATGTDIEDLYRTITGLSAQAGSVPMDPGDKRGFGLDQVPELLKRVTAAAQIAGAGLHLVGKAGFEAGNQTSNAMELILKALDKDASALGSLGYDMTKTIALNASLIQAFGNTGASAEEAADKIARIAGGLASLSNPQSGKVKQISALIGAENLPDFKNLNDVAKGDSIANLSKLYDELGKKQSANTRIIEDNINTLLGGNRQYEAATILIKAYANEQKIVEGIMRNRGAEDRLASEMAGTYKVQQQRLNAEIEGMQIAIGQAALPALQALVSWITSSAVPAVTSLALAFANMADVASNSVKIASLEITAFLSRKQSDIKARDSAESKIDPNYGINMGRLVSSGKIKYNGKTYPSAMAAAVFGMASQDEREKYLQSKGFSDYKQLASGIEEKSPFYASIYASQMAGGAYNIGKNADRFSHVGVPENLAGQDVIPPATTGASDVLKPWQTAGDVLRNYADARKRANEAITDGIRLDEQEIKNTEAKIKLHTATSSDITNSTKDTADIIRRNQAAQRNDEAAASFFGSKAAAAGAMLDKTTFGTKEWQGWMQAYNEAKNLQSQAESDFDARQSQIEQASNTLYEQQQKYVKQVMSPLMADINNDDRLASASKNLVTKSSMLSKEWIAINHAIDILKDYQKKFPHADFSADIEALQGKAAATNEKGEASGAQALSNRNNVLGKAAENQIKTFADLAEVSGIDPARVKAIQEMASLQKEYNTYLKEYQDMQKQGVADSDLAAWKATEQAMMGASAQLILFKEHLEEIKESDWYKSVEVAFNDLGQFFATSLFDDLENKGNFDKFVDNMKAAIANIDISKGWLEDWNKYNRTKTPMDRGNYALQMTLFDQQKKADEIALSQRENAEKNPPIFKKMTQDLIKQYTDQTGKSIMGDLLGNLTGTKQDPNAQMKQWVDEYIQGVNKFAAAVGSFTGATVGSGNFNEVMGMNADAMNDYLKDVSDGTIGVWGGGNGSTDAQKANAQAVKDGLTQGFTAQGNGGIISTMQKVFSGKMTGSDWGNLAANAVTPAELAFSSQFKGTAGRYAQMGDLLGGQITGIGKSWNNGKGSVGLENLGYGVDTGSNILGGFSNSLDSGIGSLLGAGAGFGLGGPAGAALGSSLGGMIGSLFGPHYNETKNPDMYADSGWAQGVANAGGDDQNGVGAFYTQATGTVTEDPTLMMALGGDTESQYLDQFVKSHPGGSGLSGASLQLWQQANSMTAGGQMTGVGNEHNGNAQILGAGGAAISGAQNWQQLLTSIQNLTQATYEFQQNVQGANQALMVFNQYGSGTGSMQYGWNTPGFQMNPNGYVPGSSAPTPGVNSSINPGGTPAISPVSGGKVSTLPVARSAASSMIQVSSNIQVDGRTLARVVQAYQQQTQSAGYTRIS